jgi:acyl carrier protein
VTPLDREEFLAYLGSELEIPQDSLQDSTALINDLGFDSIQVLDLIVVIEELGLEIPEEWFPAIGTLGEAYNVYTTLLEDPVASPDLPQLTESGT